MLIDSEPLKSFIAEGKYLYHSDNISLLSVDYRDAYYKAMKNLEEKIAELEREQENKIPCGHEFNCV